MRREIYFFCEKLYKKFKVNFGKFFRIFYKMDFKAFKGGGLVLALSRSKKLKILKFMK